MDIILYVIDVYNNGYKGLVEEIKINKKKHNIEKIVVNFTEELNKGKKFIPQKYTYSENKNSSSKGRMEHLIFEVKKDDNNDKS